MGQVAVTVNNRHYTVACDDGDNCISVPNSSQSDDDGDGTGNAEMTRLAGVHTLRISTLLKEIGLFGPESLVPILL